jgi:hypothetical protein
MTFAKQLKAHIGGLVRLHADLYWYESRSWDGVKGSVYLLLDAINPYGHGSVDLQEATPWSAPEGRAIGLDRNIGSVTLVYVLLLIDNKPKWILTSKEDMEFIQ